MYRNINSIADAQIAIREIQDWIILRSTKDWDFKGLRIKNASQGTDPDDYITLKQLPAAQKAEDGSHQFKTIYFTKDTAPADGEISPAVIIGKEQEGYPHQVWLAAEDAPSTGDLTTNLILTRYAQDNSESTLTLLASNLTLPNGQTRRVFSSSLSTATKLSYGSKLNLSIVAASGAARITCGLVIKLLKTKL